MRFLQLPEIESSLHTPAHLCRLAKCALPNSQVVLFVLLVCRRPSAILIFMMLTTLPHPSLSLLIMVHQDKQQNFKDHGIQSQKGHWIATPYSSGEKISFSASSQKCFYFLNCKVSRMITNHSKGEKMPCWKLQNSVLTAGLGRACACVLSLQCV